VQTREARRAKSSVPMLSAALDLFELTELAWHDCYGEVTPRYDVIDNMYVCFGGSLATLPKASGPSHRLPRSVDVDRSCVAADDYVTEPAGAQTDKRRLSAAQSGIGLRNMTPSHAHWASALTHVLAHDHHHRQPRLQQRPLWSNPCGGRPRNVRLSRRASR
jgi:hypothetical protein